MSHIYRLLHPIDLPSDAHHCPSDGRVFVYRQSESDNTQKRIVIGKATDSSGVRMWPNDNFKQIFSSKWEESYGNQNESPYSLNIGIYGITHYIAHRINLYSELASIYGDAIANTLLDLSTFYLTSRSNSIHSFKNHMNSQVTFSNVLHGDHWFSDFFNKDLNENNNLKFCHLWLDENVKYYNTKKISVAVSIDGSNNDCKSLNCDIAEKGYAKSHKNCNIISYIWVMDSINGRPLTYYVTYGSVPDCKSLNELIIRLKDHNLEVDPVILDRNYATHEVVSQLDGYNIPYIINLKSNSNAHLSMVEKFKDLLLWNIKYSIDNGDAFAVSEKTQIFKSHPEEGFANLFYNVKSGNERKAEFFKKIIAERDRLQSKIDLGYIPVLRKEYSKFFEIQENSDGVRLITKEDVISNEVSKKGFNCILSKKEYGVEEVSNLYSQRDVSEKQYMIMKSQLGFHTTRVHSTDSILNKMFSCFISTIIRSEIEIAAKKVDCTASEIISSFNRVHCVKLINDEYILVDSFTDKQKEFLKQLGIDKEYFDAILCFINNRNKSKDSNIVNPFPEKWAETNSSVYELQTQNNSPAEDQGRSTKVKKSAGRPKGSKNKKTLEREAELRAQGIDPDAPKPERGPGRPKGSKNKNTLEKRSSDCTEKTTHTPNNDSAESQGTASIQESQAQNSDSVEKQATASNTKKSAGRPKGSKNKKTLEREAELRAQGIDPDVPKPKRGPGRPKGSKNKKTLEREAAERAEEAKLRKKIGRPKGSKNKKTLEHEAELRAQGIDPDAPKPKRNPGRPKGSKNKKTLEREATEFTEYEFCLP